MTIYKTGDCVAFSGVSAFSQLIKAKTLCKISHVGIVIIEEGIPIICESTTLTDLPDCKTGRIVKGVQKHILKDRIDGYNGKMYHVPSLIPVPNEKAMVDWLDTIHSKEVEYDMAQALLSGFCFKKFISHANFNKLFCSELFFKAWQVGDCISKRFNASEKNPRNIINIPFLGDTLTRN